MEMVEIPLKISQQITKDYIQGTGSVNRFFDYSESSDQVYQKRMEDLQNQTFPRQELAHYLQGFHKQYDVGSKTIKNIKRLEDKNSLVVIGGQQAGLLTGPLYTIHKIISIIQLAEQQEERLGVPVLPVFWIAGEDHDFEEINHTYALKQNQLKKLKINQTQKQKISVSEMRLDSELCRNWIDEVFAAYGETEHTQNTLKSLYRLLQKSETYVDFFIHVVYSLFKESGLIVIDSGHSELRKIEKPFLQKLLKENKEVREAVFKRQLDVDEIGYGKPLEINKQNGHFFYHLNQERILMEEREPNVFYGKNNECRRTLEELLNECEQYPERFSNNVVSRPLMQEFLFPTLAFIAGPGEVAYWSVLQKAFHHFGKLMPPIVLRHLLTIVDRTTNKYLSETELSANDVLNNGATDVREQWLEQQKNWDLDKITEEVASQISEAHKPLRKLAEDIHPGLSSIAEKNIEIIQNQVHYLNQKLHKTIRGQYETELKKFDHLDHMIRPLGNPQERMWNAFYYVNLYGPEFIHTLTDHQMAFNDKHKIIFM